jgi:hypothetical protein
MIRQMGKRKLSDVQKNWNCRPSQIIKNPSDPVKVFIKDSNVKLSSLSEK